jgi:hypothetical protein
MARKQSLTTFLGFAILSVIIGGSASAADAQLFVGTWVLNVAKSDFHPGPPMKSETLVVRAAEKGGLQVTDDETFGDGTSDHLQWVTAVNGKNNPVSGGSDTDSVTERLANSTTYKAVFMKAGKPIVWETARLTSVLDRLRTARTGDSRHPFESAKGPVATTTVPRFTIRRESRFPQA